MRENTKWIMLLTAAAFVGLMVFEWGMDLSGRSSAQASGGELGQVNGQPITYDEYNAVYRRLAEQRQDQEEPISAAQNRQLEETAWAQIVMEKVIAQELERRGIGVSEEEIRQAARFAPPPEFFENELFQTDGRFDIAKYHQFLASPAVDSRLLLQLEAYYRDLIPRSKLFRQVTAGIYVPESELWRAWREANEKVRVRYLALLPDALISDAAASVSDREIASYYEAHRDEFKRPERASVRLVALDKAPTTADTAAARDRVLALRQEIRRGSDFAEVARRESADPGSAAKGGELGTFRRGQMTPAFEQAVWSLPVGQVSQPVLTQFGYHLIQVQSRRQDEAQARHILIPIERSPESENLLLERADSLEDLGERMSLAAAAEQLGLPVRTAEINEELPFAPAVGRLDDGADWAFRQAEIGDVSPVFETASAYYMLELLELMPAGSIELENVKPLIRSRISSQKKLERAHQLGRQIVGELRGGAGFEAVAGRYAVQAQEAGPFSRLDFVPGLGRANAAIGSAFGLAPGAIGGPVEAENALFILQVLERQEADRSPWQQQKEAQRERISAGLEQQRWNRFLEDLRKRAEIKDNRNQVLRPAPSADGAAN
ncbi:MAG: peptidylprolyl isomerase [Gemmatimonadetes bacterium]|nr:peptidylprolyl isomerase [Gemmatimonadota bacterium]